MGPSVRSGVTPSAEAGDSAPVVCLGTGGIPEPYDNHAHSFAVQVTPHSCSRPSFPQASHSILVKALVRREVIKGLLENLLIDICGLPSPPARVK